LGNRKDLRIYPFEYVLYDFKNFHESRRIVQRALWQLQNFRRLYYVDEYGILHIHNTLPVNQFGIKINYRGVYGLAALDLYAERIAQVFQGVSVDDLMKSLAEPDYQYAQLISDEIGDVIESVIDWYSDITKTAKEPAYEDAYEASGIYGQNIRNQWRENDSIGAEPRLVMAMGHVPEQKIKAPIIRINWLTGTGTVFIDYNLSPNYGGKGASFSVAGRDAKGNLKGYRIEGFATAEAEEVTDLTLRDVDQLDEPLDAYVLKKLHSGSGFLSWTRFKDLLDNQRDLIELSQRASNQGREDKVVLFDRKLAEVKQQIRRLVDEVVSNEESNYKAKLYELLVLGGDYAVEEAKKIFNTPEVADYLANQHEGERNLLSLIEGYIQQAEDFNRENSATLAAARLAGETGTLDETSVADTIDTAVDTVIGLISSDADFTPTREQIYTELVIRALDGKPSVQNGILPVLWDDNSLTAYAFRLDGQSVVIEIPGQDLRIDNFREQARSLKENEKKVVSAVADESILLAHDQSSAMNEYARLLESSLQLKANVAIPSGVFSEIKKSEHAEVHAKLLLKNLEWIHSQKWGSEYVFYFDPAEIQQIPKSARQAIERFAQRSAGVVVIGERPVNDGRLLFKLFASQADPESFKESHDADNSGVNVNIPVIRGGVVPNWIRYIAEAALFVNEVTATGTAAELAKAQAGQADLSIYMERLNSGLEVPIQSEIALFEFMRGQRPVSGSSFLMKPLRVIAIDALIRGARMAIATIGASA
ncbi:MAG: hypothetical protein KC649_04785, partial [Candidatus Omnitrophica bacterium]|nr:hypothetical protein [Candidatus Omnitrophota bacterium]